jgi:hypothetical protein
VAMQFVHRFPEFQSDECHESGHMLNHVIANPQATKLDPN